MCLSYNFEYNRMPTFAISDTGHLEYDNERIFSMIDDNTKITKDINGNLWIRTEDVETKERFMLACSDISIMFPDDNTVLIKSITGKGTGILRLPSDDFVLISQMLGIADTIGSENIDSDFRMIKIKTWNKASSEDYIEYAYSKEGLLIGLAASHSISSPQLNGRTESFKRTFIEEHYGEICRLATEAAENDAVRNGWDEYGTMVCFGSQIEFLKVFWNKQPCTVEYAPSYDGMRVSDR